MQRVDAHQHFWKYDPVRDRWIDETMAVIQRDFLPADLAPLLTENGFDGCVAVQADQSVEETEFLLALAADHDFIRGVVGWVDLLAADLDAQLQHLSTHKKLKGFRHILQAEKDRAFLLQPAFMQGIKALQPYGYTYDILIHQDQLHYLPAFLKAFPDQTFVIDHLAKPAIAKGEISQWAKEMEAVAAFENVSCKISGMVTEAHWSAWKQPDFRPYLDVTLAAFGVDRLLFGSDWPVCLVAASYREVVDIAETYFRAFSSEEKEKIFGGNALQFYNL